MNQYELAEILVSLSRDKDTNWVDILGNETYDLFSEHGEIQWDAKKDRWNIADNQGYHIFHTYYLFTRYLPKGWKECFEYSIQKLSEIKLEEE